MHELGETRSRNRRDHHLQTPDTFVRTPLPCLSGGLAVVHAAPVIGCNFAQYTVEFGAGGELRPAAGVNRFLYVLSGTAALSTAVGDHRMTRGGFALVPADEAHLLRGDAGARVAVIERVASAGRGRVIVGTEDAAPRAPLMGDPELQVSTLLPEDAGVDFAVNTMTYQPGASLAMVEVHVMEHGLLMLEGGGIYRLGECWYPVRAGDFIWMAAFCPQWFGALGKQPAKYLIYKDWNCHPIAGTEVRR